MNALPQYNTINELIRDGMEMRIECRKCRTVEMVEPEDVKRYVAGLHRAHAMLRSQRMQPIPHGNPDLTLRNCMEGVPCRVCGAGDWHVDVIKAAPKDHDQKDA